MIDNRRATERMEVGGWFGERARERANKRAKEREKFSKMLFNAANLHANK